jgi:acyl-coenzyme A thioesterase PaaI-like protein
MTDLFGDDAALFARLGVVAEIRDGTLRVELRPHDELLHHGVLRASVALLMVDLAAGFALDDPELWVLTTDISVRMPSVSAPDAVSTRCTVLRRGGRSGTAQVDLLDDRGELSGTGVTGFVAVRPGATASDKSAHSTDRVLAQFDGAGVVTRPLKEEASISVLDPVLGTVEMPVTRAVRNAAGTLQGAMAALVAEVAAEELVSARFGIPAVVTDLDLRYLTQTGAGPVYTRSTLLGTTCDATVQVETFDRSTERMTSFAYARAAAVPA